MTDKVQNSDNRMKVRKPDVGVVEAPKVKVKSELYNEAASRRRLKSLANEIKKADKKDTFERKQKTPGGIFCILGVAVAAVLLFKFKVFSKLKNYISLLRKH